MSLPSSPFHSGATTQGMTPRPTSLFWPRFLPFLSLLIGAFAVAWTPAYRHFPLLHLEAQRYAANNKTHFADSVRNRLGRGNSFRLGLDVQPASAALCGARMLKNQRCLPVTIFRNSTYDHNALVALRDMAANPCAYFADDSHTYFYPTSRVLLRCWHNFCNFRIVENSGRF